MSFIDFSRTLCFEAAPFRVSDWSGTPQRGNPREEERGKRDPAAFEPGHAQTKKDTRGVFGDYVSIYDIQDAVDDKATVPIYYKSRLAKLDINSAEIERLNKDVEEVLEDEEDVSAREETKSRWAELTKLVGAKERLEEVAADLVALKPFPPSGSLLPSKNEVG